MMQILEIILQRNMLIVSIIFIRNLLEVDSGENTPQMTSFQYNVDFQQISSVVFVLLLLTANFIHRYFIYVFMYIFFVEFERISHNSFTIIYYVFKEIPLFILMLLILTLNKIHNLFSVINVDFEHDIFFSEVEKFPSRLLKRVFVREI